MDTLGLVARTVVYGIWNLKKNHSSQIGVLTIQLIG